MKNGKQYQVLRVLKKNFSKSFTTSFIKCTRSSVGKMAGEDAPDKVKRANNARYREYAKMMKVERRLRRKIQEDPGLRPDVPELVLPPVILEGHARERCGACNPCKAQDCGRCSSCLEKGPAATGT